MLNVFTKTADNGTMKYRNSSWILYAFLIAGLLSSPAWAIAQDVPIWVTLEEAKDCLEAGQLSDALLKAKLVEADGDYKGDALFLIAKVYLEQGESELGIEYLQKALENRSSFYLAETEIEILTEMMHLFRNLRRYSQFEGVAAELLKKDPVNSRLSDDIKDRYTNVIIDFDYNKVLELYRLDYSFGIEAQTLQGIHYVQKNSPRKGRRLLLVSVVQLYSHVIKEMIKEDSQFNYRNMKQMRRLSDSVDWVQDFYNRHRIDELEYYLALSFYATGNTVEARSIWNLVATYGSGYYKSQAAKQLVAPFMENLP